MSDAGQGISETGFLVVLWLLTGITTVLFLGRLLVRSTLLKTYHADDVFSAVAWLLMLVGVISQTVSLPLSYRASSILIGETPAPSPAELVEMTITLRKWAVAGQTLFWTSLYCVKLSFMFLYRLAFGLHPGFRRAWTLGFVYIVVTYGVILIGVYGQCGDARNLFSYEQCMTPYVRALDSKLIWTDYVFHVTSDLIIVVLPLPVIWRLNMHLMQKLALTAICSLALITIAFETVRSVKLYELDSTLTNLYSYLELLVSVLISMLPSYRFLVSPSDKDREYRRLFWTRLTFQANDSHSSGFTMHDLSRRQTNQSDEAARGPSVHEPVPPVPCAT